MINDNFVLAIIPARGGSKGVPGKNILNLCGKPVIAYTTDAALSAISINRTVVSTDDQDIARIVANQKGIEVIMRPAEFATDTAPVELALRHAVREIERQGVKVDIVVVLYANVPVREKGIIDKVIEKLIATGADSVQTYTYFTTPPQWAYKIDGDKVSLLDSKYKFAYRRQLLPSAYHPDGAVIALRYNTLMEIRGSSDVDAFLGSDRRAVIQAPEDTVDIDEQIDLLWAEFLLKRRNKENEGS